MLVYRIARASYINDLSGFGAREYGGRWNQKGVPVVYASESRSLAVLEYLVHLPLSLLPSELRIATISIPDEIVPVQIAIDKLPATWRNYPAPLKLADMGAAWIKAGKNLLLRVPSAIVEQEFNILINPVHPDMRRISIVSVEDFRIDDRLLR